MVTPECGDRDGELIAKTGLQEFAGEHDGSADPRTKIDSVLHDFRPVVVESASCGLLASFIDGTPIGPWHTRVAQRDPGKSPLLPGDCRPVHEAQEALISASSW